MRKLCITCVVLLVILVTFTGLERTSLTPTKQKTRVISSTQYTEHDPIFIDGNLNFSATAQNEGWPGDGSLANPYKITGLSIYGLDWGDILIEIRNTDLYFQISDNILSGEFVANFNQSRHIFVSSCITFKLSNVENGLIINNTVIDCEKSFYDLGARAYPIGILINNSRKISITANFLARNYRGIDLIDSERITISDNQIYNASVGIGLSNTTMVTITNNSISNSWETGILLTSSRNNSLVYNVINNSINGDREGIWLGGSVNNIIVNNDLLGCVISLESWSLEYELNDIRDNYVNGKPLIYWQNEVGGIISNAGQVVAVNCSSILITNLNSASFFDISLYFSTNIQVFNISLSNGDLLLIGVENTSIINNTFSNDNIRVSDSYNISIHDNILSNSDLKLNGVEKISIINNILTNSGTTSYSCKKLSFETNIVLHGGLEVHAPDYDNDRYNISNNVISMNEGDGIDLHDIQRSIILNNTVFGNGGDGITLHDSHENSILNNTVSNNFHSGIEIGTGKENSIIYNTLFNNSYGLYIDDLSIGNVIRFNDFIDNDIQAYEVNVYYSIYTYNYWNDWTNPDANTDGIVDYPYPYTHGRQDPYPLTFPVTFPILAHFNSDPRIIFPNGGEILTFPITINWLPAVDSQIHQISYSLYYSDDDGTSWTSIVTNILSDPMTTRMLNYTWNAIGLTSSSHYLIKIISQCSEELISEDISDQIFTILTFSDSTSTTSSTTTSRSTSGLTLFVLLIVLPLVAKIMRNSGFKRIRKLI